MRRGEGKGRPLVRLRDAMTGLMRDGQQRATYAPIAAPTSSPRCPSALYGTITHWLETDTYPLRSRMGEAAGFLCEAIALGDRSPMEEAG